MYSLRMNLAVKFSQTTDNESMLLFATFAKRPGLGKRLRSKTVPGAAGLAAVFHISPYLDKLYEAISENPSITVQGLSDLFVADYGKFFDVEQLRVATSRLKRRHAIFKAWREELDHDFGLVRKDGLPSLQLPNNLGSMSEYDFYSSFDCGKACHRCGLRTFPSFGAPPIVGDPYTANKHPKANSLSHVCRPCCGSLPDVLESEGPKLSTDAFYYTPQLSDWPVYDTVHDVFKLVCDASMVSLVD